MTQKILPLLLVQLSFVEYLTAFKGPACFKDIKSTLTKL